MPDFSATAMAGDRLAKVIARSGLCSRRDAEGWIKDGRVTVNNKKVLTPAFNVSDSDKIKVDGEPLAARQGTRVWLYHKPAGLVVTEKDPEGRPTIFEALDEKGLPRVVSIGRLDINTEGLLLVTNDGGLKRVLELPATGWLRRYRVRAFGSVTQEQLNALKDGIEFDGVQYGPIDAQLERAQGSNTWMVLSLREGKNREVKNVLAALGLQVNRLIRVSYGPFQLGDLPEGAIETVPARVLRDQLGRRLADEAGADFDSEMPEVAAQKKPVNPKLRAAAPGKTLDRDGPRRTRDKNFRFEDDETEALAAAARDAAPRQDRPGRAPKRAPAEARPERERDIRVVHFDDGTEGEHEVKYQRPAGEKRWDPDDSSAANFGRPAHHDPKARKPREEGAEDRPRKSFGDKPAGDRAARPGADRKFGDRQPRDGDRKFGDKPFGAKKFTDKPGFGNRGRARAAGEGDDARPARKSFGDKPFNRGPREDGDRPARKFGDKPAFGKKPYAPRGDAGDRPSRPFGDKKPYAPRGDGDRPARTYTAGTKPAYGDKKPYTPRTDGDRPARTYAGTKPPYGDKKPYGTRPPREGGDRPARTYSAGTKPAYSDRPGSKPYAGKPGGKPYAGKPGGARPAGGARPGGDKPRGPRKPRP
jgi:23S rRNA pseudouridine2605 synthase